MKKFIDWIKDLKRKRHLGWDIKDVIHNPPTDRSLHLGWRYDDVHHHSDDIKEELSYDHRKELQHKIYTKVYHSKSYPYPDGAIKAGVASLGPKPTGWQKGQQSNPDTLYREPRERPLNHIIHPDQLGLRLKGGVSNKLTDGHLVDFSHSPNELHREFKEHHDSLSDDHLHYIQHYKDSSYDINELLRNTKGKETMNAYVGPHTVPHLDHSTSYETKQPLTLYRGMHSSKFLTLPVGHTFTDHGYTGTTPSPAIARQFSYATEWEKSSNLFRIHAPEGTRAHYFDLHPNVHDNEYEVVLHRGTTFKIAAHHHLPSGRKVIDLHITDQEY